jgi:hypothetical protein
MEEGTNMKTDYRNLNARVSASVLKYLGDNYKTTHRGAVTAIEVWPAIRQDVLNSPNGRIFGVLSYDEVDFLIGAHRGHKIRPDEMASRRNLEAMLADAVEFGADEWHKLEFAMLIGTLRNMTHPELVVLREMIIHHITEDGDDDILATMISGGA